MKPHELAALLTGREYGREITDDEAAQAKASGLVVVFGYSDDNIELRGAIDDEIGAYDGTKIRVGPEGVLPDWPDSSDEGWSEKEAEDYFRRKALGFQTIEAVWSPTDPKCSWAFKTTIPHATFDVMEDGELFCRGIVFALADAGPATAPPIKAVVGHHYLYRKSGGRYTVVALAKAACDGTPLCAGCGHIWRPADVPTNGVAAVKTKGKNDSPVAAPQASVHDHAYALGLARGRAEAASAAADRVRASLIVDGETPERMREAIAQRVADVGKPTAAPTQLGEPG